MGKFIDITGQKFGRWTILARGGRSHNNGTLWKCRCECGNEKSVKSEILRSGESKSCGCLSRDRFIATNTTHGMSRHPAYKLWVAMLVRCNPSGPNTKNYASRGIAVCDRWKSFTNFWEDMGPSWTPSLSLDRLDNDKGYSPDNCKWATDAQQANNTRRNRWIETPRGSMTVAQASRAFGVSQQTMHARIRRGITGNALVLPSSKRLGNKLSGTFDTHINGLMSFGS